MQTFALHLLARLVPDNRKTTQRRVAETTAPEYHLYRRWMWIQFPWLALAHAGQSILSERDSHLIHSQRSLSDSRRNGQRPKVGRPHSSSTEKGFWAVKKIAPLSASVSKSLESEFKQRAQLRAGLKVKKRPSTIALARANSKGGQTFRKGELLRRVAQEEEERTSQTRAQKLIARHFGEVTHKKDDAVKTISSFQKVAQPPLPFSGHTVRTLNHNTRFPSVEAREKQRFDRPLK